LSYRPADANIILTSQAS